MDPHTTVLCSPEEYLRSLEKYGSGDSVLLLCHTSEWSEFSASQDVCGQANLSQVDFGHSLSQKSKISWMFVHYIELLVLLTKSVKVLGHLLLKVCSDIKVTVDPVSNSMDTG